MEVKAKNIRGLETSWIEVKPAKLKASAPIVFLVHGFPDEADVWEHQLGHFKQKYLVVAPYNRGVGKSAKADHSRRYCPESILLDHLDILRTIDPKGKRKVFVVGHDIGTLYAWNLAQHLEDRCLGLVIINGASLEQFATRFKNPRQIIKSWYIWLLQLPSSHKLWQRFEPELIKRAYAKGGLKIKHHPRGLEQTTLHYKEAFKQIVSHLLHPDKKTEKVKRPVLVLCSDDDPFLETPTINELEMIADDYTIRFLQGGHWVHHSRPERVHQLIDKFMENIA